ncbi:hypothetical protein Tco_0016654 [Tanacetum coccineum]
MLAITVAGNDAAGDDDAANEDNAAANEDAGSAAEAHLVPPSPPVSPVREPTPKRQPASERPPSPSQTPTNSDLYDLDNIISMEDDTTHGGFHVESPVGPDDAPTPTADAAGRAEDPALLTSLSAKLDRVKKLEKTVKKMRDTRLVVDASTEEGDVDIQDDIDLDGLSRMASAALGQPAVPSDDVEEREEEEVPLRRKRSAYRRARTEFTTPAFEQFRANISAGVLPHTAVPEPAGLSVAADKGKAPLPELDILAEFLAEDAQAKKRFKEEQASERLVQRLRAEDLAQEDLPNVSEEHAKELDDLMMRMTETDWLNLMMQVGLNPALARELLGADVTEENFIERMTAVKERKKRALADLRYRALKGKPLKKSEVTQMMRHLVKNQWCAAHNGTITIKDVKAMNQKQLVEEYEYILSVPLLPHQPADYPDFCCGGSSHPASSATPLSGSAAPNTTISPLQILLLGVLMSFSLDSDEDEHISISGDVDCVIVDKLPDDEIVDPRVKVETVLIMPLLLLERRAALQEQMVFSSPWLTPKKESGSPLQTALLRQNWMLHFPYSLDESASPISTAFMSRASPRANGYSCLQRLKLLFFDVASSFDSAVHRVSFCFIDAVVAYYSFLLLVFDLLLVHCICWFYECWAAYFVLLHTTILLLREDLSRNLELTESKPSLGEDCWELLKTTKCRFCC